MMAATATVMVMTTATTTTMVRTAKMTRMTTAAKVTAVVAAFLPNRQQSTINNQQSTINNQQSTINNQQSTINNQQSTKSGSGSNGHRNDDSNGNCNSDGNGDRDDSNDGKDNNNNDGNGKSSGGDVSASSVTCRYRVNGLLWGAMEAFQLALVMVMVVGYCWPLAICLVLLASAHTNGKNITVLPTRGIYFGLNYYDRFKFYSACPDMLAKIDSILYLDPI